MSYTFALFDAGQFVRSGTLAKLFPLAAFPSSGPSADWLAANQAYQVSDSKSFNARTEKLLPVDPYLEDGAAYSVRVEPLTQAEIDELTEQQWIAVRADRNTRLSLCDWLMLSDQPAASDAWVTYRQALRDITQQADPFNITWPAPPAA